jgi:hypothetical protein
VAVALAMLEPLPAMLGFEVFPISRGRRLERSAHLLVLLGKGEPLAALLVNEGR